jgi:hypothetical protein
MFNHFRSHYPQGTLISEFVAVDHGKYIVRAIACVQNTTLATSLAAADTVEQAEDKARARLLTLLGIPLADAPSLATANGTSSATVRTQPHQPEAVVNSQPNQPEPIVSPPPSPPQPVAPEAVVNSQPNQPEPVVSPSPPPPQPVAPEAVVSSQPNQPELVVSPSPPPPQPVAPEAVVSSQPNQPELVASPPPLQPKPEASIIREDFDFSETIAQTNIEMKRLGWTKEQGRDYLRETYGKLSRQYLTDGELQEFLEYLRLQPSPS